VKLWPMKLNPTTKGKQMTVKFRVEDKCIAWGNKTVGGMFNIEKAAEMLTFQAEQLDALRRELEQIDLPKELQKIEHWVEFNNWVEQPDIVGFWWLFGPYLGCKKAPREEWYLHGVKNVFCHQGMSGAKWYTFSTGESHETRTDDIMGLWLRATPPMFPEEEKK